MSTRRFHDIGKHTPDLICGWLLSAASELAVESNWMCDTVHGVMSLPELINTLKLLTHVRSSLSSIPSPCSSRWWDIVDPAQQGGGGNVSIIVLAGTILFNRF